MKEEERAVGCERVLTERQMLLEAEVLVGAITAKRWSRLNVLSG